eukprot:6775391-Ditylum_brightwellii.AAC.1
MANCGGQNRLVLVVEVIAQSCQMHLPPRSIGIKVVFRSATNYRHPHDVPRDPAPGSCTRNELDIYADNCCESANWHVVDFTEESCKVNSFPQSNNPIKEVHLAKCATIYTDKETGMEMLLAADQVLWFGTQMLHSLINPNQIRSYKLIVQNDPFGKAEFFGWTLMKGSYHL